MKNWDGQTLCCPACGSGVSRVVTTRAHKGAIRRQRECGAGHRWYTAEVACDRNCVVGATEDADGIAALHRDVRKLEARLARLRGNGHAD